MRVKTTLKIDDTVMTRLKKEAARRGCTMSNLVESVFRLMFESENSPSQIPPLPIFKSGRTLVDTVDRDSFHQI
jgi:hypothetical protein